MMSPCSQGHSDALPSTVVVVVVDQIIIKKISNVFIGQYALGPGFCILTSHCDIYFFKRINESFALNV